MKKHKG